MQFYTRTKILQPLLKLIKGRPNLFFFINIFFKLIFFVNKNKKQTKTTILIIITSGIYIFIKLCINEIISLLAV